MPPPRRPAPRDRYDDEPAFTGPPPNAQSPWVLLRSANKHPFIFKRMLRDVDPKAAPGDVVNVYDKAGLLFGRGLFNPRSQIGLRMLVHGDAPVDDPFWSAAIERAVELRRRLKIEEATDAYRVVHAEGDGLSGLIVERYANYLVFEFFSLGMFQRAEMLAGHLMTSLGEARSLDRPGAADLKWQRVLRADDEMERIEGFKVPASPPASVVIREHGIRYRVDMTGGHKTGFFCDQRENRRHLAGLCEGANVLDLCCYTGGFGLAARILGKAKEVTSVDLDEAALAVAKENVNLNNVRLNLVHSDAFIYLRQMISMGRQFDVVVLDPPKLVAHREDMEEGMRKYFDLNGLSMQVVKPGGFFLTCSCSGVVNREMFEETVIRATRPAKRTLQLLARTGASPDHPILSTCPESEYLKALWYRVQ